MKKNGCHQRGNYLVPIPSPAEFSLLAADGSPVVVEGVYEAYPKQPKVDAVHERDAFPYPNDGSQRNLYAFSRIEATSGILRPERYSPAAHRGPDWLIVATSGSVAASSAAGAAADLPSEVADLATSIPSKQQLAHIALTAPGGATVAVSAADSASSLAAAEALGHLRAARTSGDRANVWVAVPSGPNWTVEDVTTEVLEKAYTRHGGVLVIARADEVADAAANKLLKTLEEPPAGTLIVLAVTEAARLLPTIRGRLSSVVRMDPPPAPQRIDMYVKAGTDPQAAEALERVCGHHFEVGAAAAGADAGLVVQALASPLAPTSTPAAAAATRVSDIEAASKVLADAFSDEKTAQRVLTRLFIERTATLLASRIPSATSDPEAAPVSLSQIRAALAATEQALAETTGGVPLKRVLVGLATRLSLSGVLTQSTLLVAV